MIRINNISSFSCMGPRTNQEDYIIANDDSRIYVLCDGMGGHGHGEVASKTIAESVFSYLSELNPIEYIAEHFQDAINFAINELIKIDTFNDERAMGTTVVVIAVNRMNILVGHIGDSRCYQLSEDGVKKFRSKDHSKVQEAVDAEILTEEEAWSSPKKNILTRCITSAQTSVMIEVDKLEIENNDVLLLCSDGVTDALRDVQLQSILVGRSVEDAADLIKTECEISSHDNFSLILLSFTQDEKNHPKKIEKVTQCAEAINVVAEYESFCPHCGKGLNNGASFCPQCGKEVIIAPKIINNPSEAKSKILSWIKEINPLWLIVGGFVVGSIVTGGVCLLLSADDVAEQPSIPSSESQQNVSTEDDINGFISSGCDVDPINSADTFVSKQTLASEYESFIK